MRRRGFSLIELLVVIAIIGLLSPGDRLWVKVPHQGFVGVGRVAGRSTPAAEFTVKTPSGEVPVLDVATEGHYHRDLVDDPQKCEHFIPIQWLETVPIAEALHEIGLFGNQNSVCQPTVPKWRSTVERMKQRFPRFDKPPRP